MVKRTLREIFNSNRNIFQRNRLIFQKKKTARAFPSRPYKLVREARAMAQQQFIELSKIGSPIAGNPGYVRWLKKTSMLAAANSLSRKYSGKGAMWQNPYARPRPRAAVKKASVWYTAYPMSLITGQDESMIASLGNDKLWSVFEEIGIEGLHTGPMKIAGGISGWRRTASIDGHFDRMSNDIDPLFGTENDFKAMSGVAAAHNAIIIDDIVPGHTGKGADFRLAEMGVGEYPGIYHMVEIDQKDWSILPDVPAGKDSVNLTPETEHELKARGYIIGKLQRVIFYEPGIKETNWSVTRRIKGVDGAVRRWVYLHYFWEGQPSINWLDPSFAGMKLVIGDALHSLGELGTGGLRLDANGFLGVEVGDEQNSPAWSEGHPLSITANQIISSMVRKLGGFTFQEVNLSIDDIKKTSEMGADLSYDFIGRPAAHHALATGDAEFLKLMMKEAVKLNIDPASLVHALQNHDELTFELVHFWTIHSDDDFEFRGKIIKGSEIRHIIQKDLIKHIVKSADYNKTFTENGIACTTASAIAAIFRYQNVTRDDIEQVAMIQKAHLLLAAYNAWQPGVFALSGWDLVGALTLPMEEVKSLVDEGDTRWINRGAYDLLGEYPEAMVSQTDMPRAQSLYGSLSEQLESTDSFAVSLREILKIRKDHGIATASLVEYPEATSGSLFAMLHRTADNLLQMTVLNFSSEAVAGTIHSDEFMTVENLKFIDARQGKHRGKLTKHAFHIECEPFEAVCLIQENE